MTELSAVLYMDESGNAGPNYLDVNQPFHVASGWLVPTSAEARARKVITDCLSGMQHSELKGQRLLKQPAGQRRAAKLLEALGGTGILPFWHAAERRFAIAGKLVDIFLDPVNNDAATVPVMDLDTRHRITECLCDADDGFLSAFAADFRAPTLAGFLAASKACAAACRRSGEAGVAVMFDGAESQIEELLELETYDSPTFSHGQWVALNVPAFSQLIRSADRFADAIGPFTVVHDEVLQFQGVMKEVATIFLDPGGVAVDLPLPDGQLYRPLPRNLRGFQVAASDQELLVQAADVLASIVARVLRTSLRDETWTPEIQRLAELTLPGMMPSPRSPALPRNGGMYAHSKTQYTAMCKMIGRGDARAGLLRMASLE